MEINIARNIKTLRKKKGYRSATELWIALELSGYPCSLSLVKEWERGGCLPTLHAVAALCTLLRCSADELIF